MEQQGQVERFEQGIIFRVARVLPLAMAGIASIMLIGAIIALIYSFTPTTAPPKQPAPQTVKVTRDEVDKFVAEVRNDVQKKSQGEKRAPSETALAIATQLDVIRKQAGALGIPWENRIDSVCASRGSYTGTCYRYESVVTAYGVKNHIESALKPYNDMTSAVETVTIDGNDYEINPSQSENKIAVLRELSDLLGSATKEDARLLLLGWSGVRESKQNASQENINKTYRDALEAHEAEINRKEWARRASLLGLVAGLVAFMIFGLLLSVLAIERHMRRLVIDSGATRANAARA
jgi:hypothetical protein